MSVFVHAQSIKTKKWQNSVRVVTECPLKAKHCWHCQQTLESKKFVDITQQCFALLPQVNFPANNLNFH